MNPFCVNLDLNIPPLQPNIDINNFFKDYWNTIPLSYINSNLISLLLQKGLDFPKAATFYSEGECVHPIHLDGVSVSDMVKINWAYGDNHMMNWYSSNIDKSYQIGKTDRTYVHYRSDEVELVHSQKVGCPSIVQTGIPHNVVNYKGTRRCISIALSHRQSKKLVTMDEALHLFNEITA